MTGSYLVAGVRTPIGRFQGGLAGLRAVELGAIAIRGALERAGLAPDQVEYTIMGHVLQAGQGQITARQAAVAAGIPIDVPAITINKVCPSGMAAIAMADQMIRAGEIEVAVAGGMESMTNAPFVLPKARAGQRLGNTPMLDAMIHDGLWCAFDDQHMGVGTDDMNREYGVDRLAAGRVGGAVARTRRRGVGRRADSTTRSCRSRSRSARATRSWSRATRASVPTRRSRGSRDWRPAFTARRDGHRRATPRRSATEPARWWSRARPRCGGWG